MLVPKAYYHLQSNGIAGRMVETVKMGLKAFAPSHKHADRLQSLSALVGRQIRALITISFSRSEWV